MKSVIALSAVLLTLCGLAWAKYDPIWQAPELPPAWSPAQASDWMGAQVQYAEAVQHYGEDSAQAAKAKARMERMSQVLRPEEVKPVQKFNLAGTNGTLARPEVFDQWVPTPQGDKPEDQTPPRVDLNIPPQ
jgi:hypothetical protein